MTDHHFSIPLTVRVNDLNYGNHVSHQNFFSYFQEARVAYLGQLGYGELEIGGYGMLISEAACKYKQALFLNDTVQVSCSVAQIRSKGFKMIYRIEKGEIVCAEGFTINICFDYRTNKVVRLPEEFVQRVTAFEGQ